MNNARDAEAASLARVPSFQVHGQVAHGVVLQIVAVPQVVSSGEEDVAVDGNDLGVVPAHALSPGPDPHAELGRVGDAGRELLEDGRAVGREADDVPHQQSERDGLVLLVQLLERGLEAGKEQPVGGRQARYVAPETDRNGK
jgi:hypothetical protein